jgi:hypothetical protein
VATSIGLDRIAAMEGEHIISFLSCNVHGTEPGDIFAFAIIGRCLSLRSNTLLSRRREAHPIHARQLVYRLSKQPIQAQDTLSKTLVHMYSELYMRVWEWNVYTCVGICVEEHFT